MGKIKILHIIKSLGRGGAEMLLPETLKLHNKSKFQFHYIYFLPWKDQMVDVIQEAGGRVTCFPAKNNLGLFKQVASVIKYCEEQQINLIHAHLPWSGFLGRLVHKKTKIPLIYTEHNIQERYHKATKFLNKVSFNSQSLALGVSADVTRSIKENISPSIPFQTLLNGVNTDKFKRDLQQNLEIRKQYDIPEDALVIGNIAVFRKQKNIPLWLETFKKVQDNYKHVFGLLVGAGPEEAHVKSLVTEYGLQAKVKFAGLQTNTIPYFSAMDIYMMSSDFEGLPISLLEAMSMGCAIISTKAGGVVEVITHKKDGLLCATGNSDALTHNVASLIENPEKLEEFQKEARKRVMGSFSLKNMVGALEDVYIKFAEEENRVDK
ncbi:glycosyltransferase [Salinimicrobium sp. TIG7-5_MAKvit]|uniref:glycosyltransferase n=1 Tax=Salinimicrobium sp. TIG7-5_MAKvit TaxID=3121289 RepID=UPI003C6E6B5A